MYIIYFFCIPMFFAIGKMSNPQLSVGSSSSNGALRPIHSSLHQAAVVVVAMVSLVLWWAIPIYGWSMINPMDIDMMIVESSLVRLSGVSKKTQKDRKGSSATSSRLDLSGILAFSYLCCLGVQKENLPQWDAFSKSTSQRPVSAACHSLFSAQSIDSAVRSRHVDHRKGWVT